MMTSSSRPKVIVIGAGPSGLVALRHLKEVADVTVFDAQSQIGGLWNYSDVTELNHPNLQSDVYFKHYGSLSSSIWKDLTCNLPRHVMTYKDFPMKDDVPTFPSREHFFDYLVSYADHFDMHRHIKLNTFVRSVRLCSGLTEDEKREWGVTGLRKFAVQYCSSANENTVAYMEADYVIVGNGHNSQPWIPKIEGDDEFEGARIPIHCFRGSCNFVDFKGKDILIIGASYSGIDLMIQLLFNPDLDPDQIGTIYVAGNTTLLENSADFKPFYETGKVVLKNGGVKRLARNNQAEFVDGTVARVDMVWYGCGYKYKFPFLDNSPDRLVDVSQDENEGKFWGPVYKKIFCVNEPNLIFIGNLDNTAIGQAIMEKQAIVVKNFVQGTMSLPGQDEMQEDVNREIEAFQRSGRRLKDFYRHVPNLSDWQYIDELKTLVGMETDPVFDATLKATATKFIEFVVKGDWLSYKAYDFSPIIPKDFKNSTEFF